MSNKDNEIKLGVRPALTVNIGYKHYVLASRIVAILENGSSPVKRMRDRATKLDLLLDATSGRKTRSMIVTDSRHVILSALSPQALEQRLESREERACPNLAQLELKDGEFCS
jgi:hypothetical protein